MTEAQVGSAKVVTINAGSSSLRISGYSVGPTFERLAEAHLTSLPDGDAVVLLDFMHRHGLARPELVMHRVVHGGQTLREPRLVDAEVEAEIERLSAFAPLHNGLALDWIQAAREAFGPGVPQAACFDTAFFADLPPHAASYALPPELCARHGIRRYGFHGLAHQSMLDQWGDRGTPGDDRRVISLQLGAGCSVTASDRGSPVETSMGFSPLEGLMMATRCGNLDPAVVLHLVEKGGMSADALDTLFNRQSGLLAISGQTGDMRALLESPSPKAKLAVRMFCHRVQMYVGAYLAVLQGARAILFGGGIGEHAATIRQRILQPFAWAGIVLDESRNLSVDPEHGGAIHAERSRVEVWVIPTDEAGVMASAARTLLFPRPNQPDPQARKPETSA
jgi:acetate kinase